MSDPATIAFYEANAARYFLKFGRLHNFPDAHWLELAYHEAGFTILASERYRGEGADGVIRDWFALTVRKQ